MSEINPDKASIEELEAALDGAIRGEMPTIVQEESAPPVPEEKPEPVVETQPPAPEPTPEPEKPAEPDIDQELLSAKEAELEARAKHWENVAGRHGSELGQLRKIVSDLQARAARPEQADDFSQPEPPQESKPQPADDKIKSWAIAQAIRAGAQEFSAAHADSQEHMEAIQKYLSDSGYNPDNLLYADDPLQAQKESNRVLTEAYWSVKAAREAARVTELRTKKAAQMAGLEEAKRKAATTAPATPPPPPVKAKTIDEMTADELDAEIKKLVPVWRG